MVVKFVYRVYLFKDKQILQPIPLFVNFYDKNFGGIPGHKNAKMSILF